VKIISYLSIEACSKAISGRKQNRQKTLIPGANI